jgi:hypothetical protein
VQTLPSPDTTLLALLTALFDECSYYGSPEARDQALADLRREAEEPKDGERLTRQRLREDAMACHHGRD